MHLLTYPFGFCWPLAAFVLSAFHIVAQTVTPSGGLV